MHDVAPFVQSPHKGFSRFLAEFEGPPLSSAMGCTCASSSGNSACDLECKEDIYVGFHEVADLLNQDGPCSNNMSSPLLGKDNDLETSEESSVEEDTEEEHKDQDEQKPMPWIRFAALWVCVSLAAGVLPGQSLFAQMFADAGVFSSSCVDGKPGCTDPY